MLPRQEEDGGARVAAEGLSRFDFDSGTRRVTTNFVWIVINYQVRFRSNAKLVPLKDSIMALQKAGHQVAVISPLPSWPDGAKIGPAYCGLVFSLVINCRVTMNLVEVSSDYYWNLSEKVKKAAQSMQVSVIDVVPEICPGSVCETRTRSGDWVWNDRHHISSLAAQKLAPTFRALLSE